MNPTAIYSKSGKGVQEASGKTSILKRPDRAVLSAIDGRATLAEVAEKVGKPFDPAFEALISQLDKDGFVREVNPGVAPAAPKAAAPAKGKAAPPPPPSDAPDLDFSATFMSAPKPAAPPPPPKPSGPSPAELAAKAEADKRAKEQQAALAKARQEAEARAQAEREKVRKEAEEKIRAETEARIRKEAEEKMKADTDAKAKVVRAAAEAKVKAEAEAKKAREEADRARREAEEKAAEARKQAEAEAKQAREEAERARKEAEVAAERARKEAEEKAKREQEEMRRQLEAERKAREEAERKAREEAERARKEAEEKAKREQEEMRRQLEEERKRLEAERKQREEEDRKRREQEEQERAARRKREEEEEQARRRKREEEERKEAEERAARRKRDEEEEERRREERARREKEEEEERARRQSATELSTPALKTPPPPPPSQPAAASTGGMDSLLADLDSFGQREEEERKAKEEAERKAREEKERKAREAEEKRRREEEERARQEAEDKRRREEEERRAREDEERRQREEEERARAEAEERKRRARETMAKAAQAATPARSADDDIGVSDADLDMDDVKADEAKVSVESRSRAKERERERAEAAEPVVVAKSKKPVKWGKPVALTLFVLLVAGIGAIHVMPVSVSEYENAASEALGQPVKLGSGRVSLFTGVKVTFNNAQVGPAKIATVRASPDFGSLFGPKKNFSRIELEGLVLPQAAVGEAVFTKLKGDSFRVAQVSARQMKLDGPLVLPALDADAAINPDGAVRSLTLRGPDNLVVKIAPKESEAEFDMSAGAFSVPFAPEVKFSSFAMKGTANRQGMNIASWDGSALTGTLSGTASIRWASSTWVVDGVITARGINAGVFAPALLSEGRGEGTGKFSMNGEPAQLASSSRVDANFTINKGALSLFDLSRAIQTGGRQSSGRTAFAEMTGQATYDKGTVALRNVTMGAGALNAGISADIAESGALSGRIVADVKTATQTLRATFSLAGTVKEPQVK